MAKKSSAQKNKSPDSWERLNAKIVRCRRCPRLIEHGKTVAKEKRRAFQDWTYWGKPLPNFGDPQGRLLVHGLAPAAHGATRTGRMFTGDRSGQWLYRALYRAGFSSAPESLHKDDGLKLKDCVISGAAHCAPPQNKPTREELEACESYLSELIDTLPVKVFLALGSIAYRSLVKELQARQWLTEKPTPKFGHNTLTTLNNGTYLLSSYHPSQQNTFTGRLTEDMFDEVFVQAKDCLNQG